MNQDQIEQYKKILCEDCAIKITEPLQEVCDLLNSDKRIDQAKGTIKLTRLRKKLYKRLCPECLNKMLRDIPQVGL